MALPEWFLGLLDKVGLKNIAGTQIDPATEQKQDTGNTSLDNIDTKVGEVQASPTTNTVLARLKDLLTGIVLAAGTAVIGYIYNIFTVTNEAQLTWANVAVGATNVAPAGDPEFDWNQARDIIAQCYQTGSTSIDIAVISNPLASGGTFDDYDRPLRACNLASTDRKSIEIPAGSRRYKFRASNPGTGTATSITVDLVWRK